MHFRRRWEVVASKIGANRAGVRYPPGPNQTKGGHRRRAIALSKTAGRWSWILPAVTAGVLDLEVMIWVCGLNPCLRAWTSTHYRRSGIRQTKSRDQGESTRKSFPASLRRNIRTITCLKAIRSWIVGRFIVGGNERGMHSNQCLS
jgi:hypothetical protein